MIGWIVAVVLYALGWLPMRELLKDVLGEWPKWWHWRPQLVCALWPFVLTLYVLNVPLPVFPFLVGLKRRNAP